MGRRDLQFDALAVGRYQAGESLREVAAALGCSTSRVLRALMWAGVPTRPRSVRKTLKGSDDVLVSRDLLESFIDSDGCWFDHNGGCQAHGYLSLQPGELCPQAELKQLLNWTES